jgi:hypothetical protein
MRINILGNAGPRESSSYAAVRGNLLIQRLASQKIPRMCLPTFLADSDRPSRSQVGWSFGILFFGSLLSAFTSFLVSRVQPERLDTISQSDITQALLVALFCYCLGICLVWRLSTIARNVFLFTIVFNLRLITAFLLAFILQYDDERVFHAAGTAQLYGLYSWNAGRGYYHVVNSLYALFEPNLLLPKILNSFVGALLPFVIYDLVWRLNGNRKAACCSFVLSAFAPPLVVYSAVNLKEITTAFALVITVWFITAGRNKVLLKVAGCALATAGLYLLRGAYWAVVPLAGLVVSLVLGEFWRIREMATAQWVGKSLLVFLGMIIIGPAVLRPITGTIEERLSPESYYAERFAGSSAAVMQVVDASNSLSVSNLAILFVRGLYTPSPLRFIFDYGMSVGTLIEASVGFVWYLTFPFAVVGFIAERHKGTVLACGVMMVVVLIMAGVSVMFGSNPYRHRTAAMGLVFVLAGIGWQNDVRKSHRWVLYLWWTGAIVFNMAWLAFRV